MAFLKRMSDSLWSYVSPRKATEASALPTPKTEPTFKKPSIPVRRASIHDITKHTRSMSPGERVGNWRGPAPSNQSTSPIHRNKRKRLFSPSSSAGRRSKTIKRDSTDMEFAEYQTRYGDDVEMDDMSDEESALQSPFEPRSSSAALGDEDDEDEVLSFRQSVLASDDDYMPQRRVVQLPKMVDMGSYGTEDLRAQGWDDDYITLVQKILRRGFEPLLPAYLKFEYSFMPDGLFEQGEEAFVASVRGEDFKAGKALQQLMDLGGRVRDCIEVGGKLQPEEQIKRQLEAYMEFALDDGGIDKRTAIPILAIEVRPAGFDAPALRAIAFRKCVRLAARYREALKVRKSVEISPGSRSSEGSLLSYPLPTFYAVIASHAVFALMAYNPDAGQTELQTMAFFDLKQENNDVWNSLALAIIACHVRNVQMRIADETGLGLRSPTYSGEEMEEDDGDF